MVDEEKIKFDILIEHLDRLLTGVYYEDDEIATNAFAVQKAYRDYKEIKNKKGKQ